MGKEKSRMPEDRRGECRERTWCESKEESDVPVCWVLTCCRPSLSSMAVLAHTAAGLSAAQTGPAHNNRRIISQFKVLKDVRGEDKSEQVKKYYFVIRQHAPQGESERCGVQFPGVTDGPAVIHNWQQTTSTCRAQTRRHDLGVKHEKQIQIRWQHWSTHHYRLLQITAWMLIKPSHDWDPVFFCMVFQYKYRSTVFNAT